VIGRDQPVFGGFLSMVEVCEHAKLVLILVVSFAALSETYMRCEKRKSNGDQMKMMRQVVIFVGLAVALMSRPLHAAVSVSFDAADSNIGAGFYDFMLSGAPSTAVFADFNSSFNITGWAAPAIGNNMTLVSKVAPSAWNVPSDTLNEAVWALQSTTPPNNVVDGRFEVQAKPNLHGTLNWQFNWPADNTLSASGMVVISAVPEPRAYGLVAGAGLLGLFVAVGSPRLKAC
jgi:hypothetical protein